MTQETSKYDSLWWSQSNHSHQYSEPKVGPGGYWSTTYDTVGCSDALQISASSWVPRQSYQHTEVIQKQNKRDTPIPRRPCSCTRHFLVRRAAQKPSVWMWSNHSNQTSSNLSVNMAQICVPSVNGTSCDHAGEVSASRSSVQSDLSQQA